MKLFYIKKHRFIVVFMICVFLSGSITAQDKIEKTDKIVSVSLKVVDDNGNSIPNTQVIIGERLIQIESDENGIVLFNAFPDDFVTITSSGYEKNVSLVQEILMNNTIKLKKSKLYMSSDDNIPLPFLTLKKRKIPGSVYVMRSEQLEKYPSTDLRNAYTGLATGVEVLELNGQPGLNAEEKLGIYNITDKITISARGRSMVHIIDNIPIDITEMPLDPDEIESISIIKGIVGKAMYGPAGADGIIFIKTKHGNKNQRIRKVNIESGISVIDRFPEWTSGADYAMLNNQARINDGLTPHFTDSDIASYSLNDPYDKYHPSVNYREMLLKNTRSFRRANISSSGGNDRVRYAAFLGYNGEDDIYKIGPMSDYNRINARSNIDISINDFLKIKFGFFAGLTKRRSANYGYSTSEYDANMDLLEFNAVIKDITSIPPIAFPVYANNDPSLEKPWYGVSNAYKNNTIGDLTEAGFYTESDRIGANNISLDFDMNHIIKGLKSTTYIGFSLSDLVRIGKAENYPAYIVSPDADSIRLTFVHDGISTPNLSNLHDYFSQRFAGYESLNYDNSFGNNSIQMALTYFISKVSRNMIDEPERQQNGVWTGIYSYNDKYSIQGVLNYAGSSSFAEGKRFELFPSVGVSWVISEETFMSKLNFLDYFKLRAEAGILGYNNFLSPFYFRDNWNQSKGANFGPYSAQQWFGSTKDNSVYRTSLGRIGNPNLSWEKRKEFSIGIDALMFNQKLSFEANYYNNLRDGEITQLINSLPYVAGYGVSPLFNYNKTRYFGLETRIQFTNSIGKFEYSIGGNATIQNSKYVKFDEPNYRFAYQFHTGTATDTYWGLSSLGKFKSDAEAIEVLQLFDDVLHKGDLKYEDMNLDGVVDDNDQVALGHTSPRLFYALTANLKYKNFDVTIIGTGRAFYDLALTNRYYWNGWGDDNYSNFVKDNIGGAYPKLNYNKVNNNFVNSDFWLTNKGDYFKIQNIELAYNLPSNILKIFSGGRGVRVYVRGANLLTISKVKDVDPESIDSGIDIYPLYKTFSGGIKLTF